MDSLYNHNIRGWYNDIHIVWGRKLFTISLGKHDNFLHYTLAGVSLHKHIYYSARASRYTLSWSFAVMTSKTLLPLLAVVVACMSEGSTRDTSRNHVYEATGSCQVWAYRQCENINTHVWLWTFIACRRIKSAPTSMQPSNSILEETGNKQLASEQ